MDEEIKDTIVEAETEIVEDLKDPPKGEDIYVENDPRDLERMLGIAPSDLDDEEDGIPEEPKEDEAEDEWETEEPKEDASTVDVGQDLPTPAIKEKPVLLSDFMDEDKETFNYLSHDATGFYQVLSLPLDDKKSIRHAVKSTDYVFRYPRYVLRDKVLGFYSEIDEKDFITYTVFFPEYTLRFSVDDDHVKPYSESFKEYFEDLVTRVRPANMRLDGYKTSLTINSLKVVETGILEVSTDSGTKTLILNNPHISFHSLLGYIRELSDQGEDTLTLKILPEFFTEIEG